MALGVLDLLDLDLLPMQLVHVGDHIHALLTEDSKAGVGARPPPTRPSHAPYTPHTRPGRRSRLPPVACWAARSAICLSVCLSISFSTWRAWTSMSTKEGTGSSSSLSVALKAPVAEPGLMKSLPSAQGWGWGWGDGPSTISIEVSLWFCSASPIPQLSVNIYYARLKFVA